MSRPHGKPFTPADDAVILARYRRDLLNVIAKRLGRPAGSVVYRFHWLAKHGHLNPSKRFWHHRPWTEADDEFLSDNWGMRSDAWVAGKLKRTIDACKIRAFRHLKISRKQAFWTSRDVATLFGVDSHKITLWIRNGWLEGHQGTMKIGPNPVWMVHEPAIIAFIHAYPWEYNRHRIERDTYYRNLADRVAEKDPWLTVPQAALMAGVCIATIRRHLNNGWLAGVKVKNHGHTGTWKIAKSELARFEARHPTTKRDIAARRQDDAECPPTHGIRQENVRLAAMARLEGF